MTTQEAVMTTQEVADRFYQMTQDGNFNNIQDELFAPEAVSIEPANVPGMQNAEGLAAIKQKAVMFQESVEAMHGSYTSKPVVGGRFFSVAMGIDATMKGAGRTQMDEICVYEVRDGRIVREQFFF